MSVGEGNLRMQWGTTNSSFAASCDALISRGFDVSSHHGDQPFFFAVEGKHKRGTQPERCLVLQSNCSAYWERKFFFFNFGLNICFCFYFCPGFLKNQYDCVMCLIYSSLVLCVRSLQQALHHCSVQAYFDSQKAAGSIDRINRSVFLNLIFH